MPNGLDINVVKQYPDWVTINFGLNNGCQNKGAVSASRIPVKISKKDIEYFERKVKKKRKGTSSLLIR